MNLCIYHGGCTDGVASAWVVWNYLRKMGERELWRFHPGVYGGDPPWDSMDEESHVYLVDFSYKRPVMEKLIADAAMVTVLDHHKTAQVELEPLLETRKLAGSFDMNRCGALMAWDWFFPNKDVPSLMMAIDAQDRWTQERDAPLIMALRSYAHAPVDDSPEAFDTLMKLWNWLMQAETMTTLRQDAKAIHRYYRMRVEETKNHAKLVKLDEFRFPAVNAPYHLASDVAGELAEDSPHGFAAVWWQNRDGQVSFSLRSRGDFDVSELAAKHGGGGHRNAAGFKMAWDDAVHVLALGFADMDWVAVLAADYAARRARGD